MDAIRHLLGTAIRLRDSKILADLCPLSLVQVFPLLSAVVISSTKTDASFVRRHRRCPRLRGYHGLNRDSWITEVENET